MNLVNNIHSPVKTTCMDAGPLPHLNVGPLQDQVETDGGCGDGRAGPVLWSGEGGERENVQTGSDHGCLVTGTLPITRQQEMKTILNELLQQQHNVHSTPPSESAISWSVISEQLLRLPARTKEIKKTLAISPGGRSARAPRRGGRGQSSHHKTQPAPSTTTIPNKVQLCATLSYCGILREEFMYSVCLVLALYKPFKPFM